MRKNFLIALLGIVAMLTSCNKEEVGSLATNKATSFKVSVDGGVKTRAAVTDLSRYVMEIYKGATAMGTPEVHKEQATGVFSNIVLELGQEYIVLFWADYGTPGTDGTNNAGNEYNATDLKAARVAETKQATKAAYSGVSKFTLGTTDESVYTAVTLTHAVAQVNFVQNRDLVSATNTLVVSYPESYCLNVGNNTVTKIDGAITHNFTFNQKAKGTLGTSYIIAATGTPKTVLEITATLNSETAINVSNVPFERNFKTNISGAYSSKYAVDLTVTCDDIWDGTDNDVVFTKTIIFSDDFEDFQGSFWMRWDGDGDGINWVGYKGAGWGYHSDGLMYSESYKRPTALTPDNLLVSPQIALPASGSIEVSWWINASDASDFAEKYSVYVVEATQNHQDLVSDVEGYKALASSIMSTVKSATADYTKTLTANEWTNSSIIIPSQFAGKNVYIVFRHYDCSNMFRLKLDNFVVAK